MYRRIFLEKISQLSLLSLSDPILSINNISNSEDEQYWKEIKRKFPIASKQAPFLNLNSGSAGVMPEFMISAVQNLMLFMNTVPPYQALDIWKEQRLLIKDRLAAMIGAQTQEIQLLRNTTEALSNIVKGINLEKGDHIIACEYDYPYVLNALKFKAKKEGLDLEILQYDVPIKNDKEVISKYLSAIKKNTKLVLLTHMSHSLGYILPINKLKAEINRPDIEYISDAAHSLAQIDFSVKETDLDYLGTSLHKWLMGPIGTGLMYIKESKIQRVEPLFAPYESVANTSIDKFQYLGTHAYYNELGIQFALDFHNRITTERKRKRLIHLVDYLHNKLNSLKEYVRYTPTQAGQYGGILSFALDGVDYKKTVNRLKSDHGIIVKKSGIRGRGLIRVSPNIFTLESDLDYFFDALLKSMIRY